MERFADGIEAATREMSDLRVRPFVVEPDALASRFPSTRFARYWQRYVSYPRQVRGLSSAVYHVIDHGYADLVRFLPAPKTLVTCHDLMLLGAAEGSAGFHGRRSTTARFRWSVSFLRKVAHVACDSHSTQADVWRLCGVPEDRTSVVYLGVEPIFRPLALENENRSSVMLHVTTGAPYKNVAGTIRVLEGLRLLGVDIVLWRVGPKLAADELAQATRAGVDEFIVDHGRVSDDELLLLYNRADVFVYPSSWEGFGWPPLEAMACGTPVVASNRASLPEVLGNAAILVEPDDVAAFVQAVRSIVERPDLASAWRERGLARAKRFTWQRTAEAYRDLYLVIADGTVS